MTTPSFVKFRENQVCTITVGHRHLYSLETLDMFRRWIFSHAENIKTISIKLTYDSWGATVNQSSKITHAIVKVICDNFTRLIALRSVTLPGVTNSLTASHLVNFAPSTLKQLHLLHCEITAGFMQSLATFLASPRCGVDSVALKGARYEKRVDHLGLLAPGIAKNASMTVLDIDNIVTTIDGFIALADALIDNTTLETLRCSTDHVGWVAQHQKRYSTDWFCPSPQHEILADKLSRVVAKNNKLTHLALPRLTCMQLSAISDSITCNTTLRRLLLTCLPVTSFDKVFMANTGLSRINATLERNDKNDSQDIEIAQPTSKKRKIICIDDDEDEE